MARSFFSYISAFICYVGTAIHHVYERAAFAVHWAFDEAFTRVEPSPAQRHAVAVASAELPAFVGAYTNRRLARLPNRRRGPWADMTAGLPLAA